MKKVLVTGGNGFLGHHIVRELSNRRIETIVYDIAKSNFIDDMMKGGHVHFVEGDILDISTLENAMEGCDAVFHTAAIANLDDAANQPVKTIEINVLGTVNCLEAARKQNVDRFVFASSVYVGGNWGSFYRISKQTGESLCKTYCDEFDLDYSIIRYGSLYGREANEWNFLYYVCRELLTKKEYNYFTSPNAVREFIHINDASRETVNIAQNDEYKNKAVLITGHQKMTMRQFFDMFQEILGYPIKVNFLTNNKSHYEITPYSFEADVPVRINLPSYIDIYEGVMDCLREAQKEIEGNQQHD